MVRSFGGDGQTKQLTRQTHGIVANINHLLHFAERFRQNLTGLYRNQAGQVGLGRAQFHAQETNKFTPLRGWSVAPLQEGRVGLLDRKSHLITGRILDMGHDLAGDGRGDGTISTGPQTRCHVQSRQNRRQIIGNGGQGMVHHRHLLSGGLGRMGLGTIEPSKAIG